jgi:aspartate/methionine/tyrosine aminotransferase
MKAFHDESILDQIVFVCSFSKTFSLTGERFGWVVCADRQLMTQISPSWSNTIASLPGEWQLRFMAYYQLLRERAWLGQKMRNFYRLRRRQFIEQLQEINQRTPLFEEIYIDDDATVYNWSKMLPEVDTFSLFEKTGIAGVPGSGFGYTDRYIRFSIGVLPIRS